MANIAWIFIGGGLGSLARYGLSLAALRWQSPGKGSELGTLGFPWGTFSANVLASALAGVLMAWLLSQQDAVQWRAFGLIGFCGGFSTFSSFSLEAFQLFHSGQAAMALVYITASFLSCILAVWLGMKLW